MRQYASSAVIVPNNRPGVHVDLSFVNDPYKPVLGILTPTLFLLVGCGARGVGLTKGPRGCELKPTVVCASTIERSLKSEAVRLV